MIGAAAELELEDTLAFSVLLLDEELELLDELELLELLDELELELELL